MLIQHGDKASIIAPASQFRGADRHLLSEAMALLETWGLRPVVQMDNSHHFYLAGTDTVRAGHLLDALNDQETKVVFCTRGGYGSPRLLPYLAASPPPPQKVLVGFSDVTALQMAIGRLWPQIALVHGPNIATKQLLGQEPACERNRQALYNVLFCPDFELCEGIEFLLPGCASGPLAGGCLSLVTSVLGTPFAPLTEGSVLFLEDTGEAPYKIDRMLTQLKNARKFDGVKGVVFGAMRNCTDPYNDLKDVLRDFFKGSAFPVGFGLNSGHGEINLPLRLSAHCELDSETRQFHQRKMSIK